MIGHRLDKLPLPIANPARQVAIARDHADRLIKSERFIELSAIFLGCVAMGWCRARDIMPGGMRAWEKKLDQSGPTLYDSIALIRSARKEMARAQDDAVAQPITLAITAATNGLETFRTAVRNPHSHGARPPLYPDQRSTADELDRDASVLLDALTSLERVRIGLIRSCLRRGASHQVDLEELTGPGEPFAVVRLRAVQPHKEGSVIAFHPGSLEYAVDLAPYIEHRHCPKPKCGREELFYLHRRDLKKNRSHYLSFSSAHGMVVTGDVIKEARRPPVALGMEPLSSTQSRARIGWRANWADLAPRGKRIAARLLDLLLAATMGVAIWLVAGLFTHSPWTPLLAAGLMVLAYEPIAALTGGTPGKRLLHIEPISTWNRRRLARSDLVRRALFLNAQLILPPLAIRSLAWLLWDPARQCLHDRRAASVVINGRAEAGQKR